MFATVGRRLALLNAVVVVSIIASVGIVTFALLRQSLDREADQVLAERAEAARGAWADLFAAQLPATAVEAEMGQDELREENERDQEAERENEAQEVLESGDVLLFAVGAGGQVIANSRGLPISGLPDLTSAGAALGGDIDTRTVIIEGESVRVLSAPVRQDDRINGVVQAARSDREHQSELRLVGWVTLAGVGLGAVIAIPAGLFLAQRAMRPIDLAFARQRAFVADASHELRTPLTLIRATGELVQRLPDASPAVQEELTALLSEVDATNRLVDDLLLLARLDSAELPLEKTLIDLGATVQAAAAPFAHLTDTAKLEMTIDLAPDLIVNADANRVRQIVRILVDNAIAYTPGPGKIDVTATRRGTRGVVAVRDTGVGIAPEDQRHIFDRFYRADRSRSRVAGGAGLGLAIARALVQALGGEIGLESEPKHGTTVWFSLPLARME